MTRTRALPLASVAAALVAAAVLPATLPAPAAVNAATVTSTPQADAYVDADNPTDNVGASSDEVLVGAGDIAACGGFPPGDGGVGTANLLDNITGSVYTAGDNAYPDGSDADYSSCYDPSWGRHKSRTRPTPGNHEYNTANASGYFNYFGSAAGEPGKGYYSFDLGDWHVVAINSNCSSIGGCDAGSPQEQWLRQDLAANTRPCTIAYWHHPRFSSGQIHGSTPEMGPIFQALFDNHAEIVVSGHEHQYERFAPQDPNANADPDRGIRQFVAGTGGAFLYAGATPLPNSEVRNGATNGVLKFTLSSSGYAWDFIPVEGQSFTDSGTGTCH